MKEQKESSSETLTHSVEMTSQLDADIPISSAVVMLSPPDTQEGPQDVFHTPPEDSLLPSSDVDAPLCTVNQAVDVDGSQAFVDLAILSDDSEFVDFGKDSQLGFSQENSQLEIRVHENFSDEIRVLKMKRENSDLDEGLTKKLKLGFGYSGEVEDDGIGNFDDEKVENECKIGEDFLSEENVVDCEEVNMDDVSNGDLCREIPMDVNSVPKENVEMQNSVLEENVEMQKSVSEENVETQNSVSEENVETQKSVSEENVEMQKSVSEEEDETQNSVSEEDVEMHKSVSEEDDETQNSVSEEEDETQDSDSEEVDETEDSVLEENDEVQNLVLQENVETEVVKNAGNVNLIMGNQSSNKVNEGFGTNEDSGLHVLPNKVGNVMEEATANGSGSRKDKEIDDLFVFDLLKVLATKVKEDEEEASGHAFLKAIMLAGITFPRPCYWPKDMKSKLFKFDDEVKN